MAATERQPVALDQIAAERVARARPWSSDLTIRTDLRALVVEGDAALLGQLVENLLDNAAKYNVPRGWIQVRVRRDGGHGILEVANSGPKVREDEIAGLLEPFRRATQQRVGRGNGLGLSIVRTIVAAHDGQLALHALPDGGLRVTVTLPCPAERLGDQAADEHPVTHGRQQSPSTLLSAALQPEHAIGRARSPPATCHTEDINGAVFALPAATINPESPAFEHAATACHLSN